MDLPTISGAGGTIPLGGRLLTLRQLNIGEVGEMQAWLKERTERPFQKAVRKIQDLLPLREFDPEGYERERAEILLQARNEENGVTAADTQPVEDLAKSLEGVAYMLWLSCREKHPDTTYEWVRKALLSEDVAGIHDKLDAINEEWMKHVPKKKGEVLNGLGTTTSTDSTASASKS